MGLGGADVIRGGNDDDVICGGAGDDNLRGENGVDTLLAVDSATMCCPEATATTL